MQVPSKWKSPLTSTLGRNWRKHKTNNTLSLLFNVEIVSHSTRSFSEHSLKTKNNFVTRAEVAFLLLCASLQSLMRHCLFPFKTQGIPWPRWLHSLNLGKVDGRTWTGNVHTACAAAQGRPCRELGGSAGAELISHALPGEGGGPALLLLTIVEKIPGNVCSVFHFLWQPL